MWGMDTPHVCGECAHIHTLAGCTGPRTPSDIWAGVTVDSCDCDGEPGFVAGVQAALSALADLAASFQGSIDWSDGRNNYGDNEAYAACARDLRDFIKENTRG